MKKTLLIAAATLAAGVIAAQADSPVYSQNIVGYVNTVIPKNGVLTLVNNPLQVVSPAGVTNDAETSLTCLQGGEELYIWNGGGYYVYAFAGAGVGTSLGYASDWYDVNGGLAGAIPGTTFDSVNQVYWTHAPILKQGMGVYISNPNSTPETNTFVGSVVLSTTNAPITIPANGVLTLVSSALPIGGNIQGTNFNLPFIGGEEVYIWNGGGYYVYAFAGAGVGTGLGYASDFYDVNGGLSGAIPGTTFDSVNQVYWTQPLNVSVGQGYFISNPNSTPETWSQNLIVQ
jgi:hypothetical protein